MDIHDNDKAHKAVERELMRTAFENDYSPEMEFDAALGEYPRWLDQQAWLIFCRGWFARSALAASEAKAAPVQQEPVAGQPQEVKCTCGDEREWRSCPVCTSDFPKAQPQVAGQARELPPLPQPYYPQWSHSNELAAFTAEQMQDYARAAQAAPAVPDGWKLVPKVPTVEMINRGYAAYISGHGLQAAYCAMLAAAPSAPTQEGKA